MRQSVPRHHTRQQLILKVEFDDVAGFRSNYLSDLSQGGVRVNTTMEVGQRFMLNLSFLGFLEPIRIEAVVQWTLAADDPEGPASGLAFVDPTPEAQIWLNDILDASTQIFVGPEKPSRVLLLETQAFLREIYGQEVRNWAELRDEEPLDLQAFDSVDEWMVEVTRDHATLGIIDVDGLSVSTLELYHQVRNSHMAAELPLIVLGEPAGLEPFSAIVDDLLFCLRKPLRFGLLMNTVRMLARDPQA